MSSSEAVRAWATNRGFVMARHVFKKRGNKTEVHLGLQELSVLMTACLELGVEHALDIVEKAAKAPATFDATADQELTIVGTFNNEATIKVREPSGPPCEHGIRPPALCRDCYEETP